MRRPKVVHSEITARRLRRRRATIGTTVQQQTITPRHHRRRGSRTGGRVSAPSLPTTTCNHSATMMGDMAIVQSPSRPSQVGQKSAMASSLSNSVVPVRQTRRPASRSRKGQSSSRPGARRRLSCPQRHLTQSRSVKRARARSASSHVAFYKRPRLAVGRCSSSDAGHNSSCLGSQAGSVITISGTVTGNSLDDSLEFNNRPLEVSQNQCCSALLYRPEVAPVRFTIKGKRRADPLLSAFSEDANECSDVGLVDQNDLSAHFPLTTSNAPMPVTVDTANVISSSSVSSNQDIGVPSSWSVFSQPQQEEVEHLAPNRSSHCGLDLLNSDSDEEDDEGEIDLYADDDENDGNNNSNEDNCNNKNDNTNNSNTGGALYQVEMEDNADLYSFPSYSTQEEDSIS